MPLELELDQIFSDELAERITYRSGSVEICDVPAIRVEVSFDEVADEESIRLLSKAVSWVIEKSQFLDGNEEIEPARGAEIETADGQVFQVFPEGNVSHWKWYDQFQATYCIHTIRRSA